jgi:hypothetical protein
MSDNKRMDAREAYSRATERTHVKILAELAREKTHTSDTQDAKDTVAKKRADEATRCALWVNRCEEEKGKDGKKYSAGAMRRQKWVEQGRVAEVEQMMQKAMGDAIVNLKQSEKSETTLNLDEIADYQALWIYVDDLWDDDYSSAIVGRTMADWMVIHGNMYNAEYSKYDNSDGHFVSIVITRR